MASRAQLRQPPGIGYHPKLEPHEVERHPELAILEAADAILETAAVALIAANPALTGPDPFEPADGFDDDAATPTPRLYAADTLIYLSYALRSALDRYRCAVHKERP
jgi:hypothetical protein